MSNTTRQPVAWGIQWAGDTKPDLDCFFSSRYEATMYLSSRVVPGTIVPVYLDPPPPTLTDAERVVLARNFTQVNGEWLSHISEEDQYVLNALLDKLIEK